MKIIIATLVSYSQFFQPSLANQVGKNQAASRLFISRTASIVDNPPSKMHSSA